MRRAVIAGGVLVAVACGGGESDSGEPMTDVERLCDSFRVGYATSASCRANGPTGFYFDACVAAADIGPREGAEGMCSELYMQTLRCGVRVGSYQCDEPSGQIELPGGAGCQAEWEAYGSCLGRIDSTGQFAWFPWTACEFGDASAATRPFRAELRYGSSFYFDERDVACACACVDSVVPVCDSTELDGGTVLTCADG